VKERSKQQPHSKQKIQTTSKSSGPESSDRQAASTLRTASTKILNVLDPRVQRAAAKVVEARRQLVIKRRLPFIMDRRPLKIRPTKELTDKDLKELDSTINQLQGEMKRDETIRKKNSGDPEG